MLTLFMLANPARAQVTTGAIEGTVTDGTGAVVPSAVVTIEDVGTGIKRVVTTNTAGEFVANLLEPGPYNVTASFKGFKAFQLTGLRLDVGRTERVNAVLAAGAMSETVTVSGDAESTLQTDSATVQSSIDRRAVQDLPLNNRNFVNLVQQAPGVNAGNSTSVASGGHPDDRRDSSSVSANGQGSEFNNQQIDGLDNNERQQGLIGVRPSVDSISEIRILTNNFPAEVGRAGGAVVNVITKAGGNKFHGDIFEFFRNDIFDTRDFFAKTGSIAKPELRQNDYGASVGGPILRDKTFFFVAYEGQRRVAGQTFVSTVPTTYEAAHPGDFTDYNTNGKPGPFAARSSLNPIAVDMYAMYPLPNQAPSNGAGTGIPVNNFVYSPARTLYTTNLDARVDHHFNDKNTLYAHFSYNPTSTYTPTELPPAQAHGFTVLNTGAPNFAAAFGAIAGPSTQNATGYFLDYLHIFTPQLAMELKAGFTRLVIKSNTQNFGKNISDAFGFPNSNLGTPDTTGLVNIMFFGGPYASLGDSYFEPLYDTNNIPQTNGTVTYVKGAHNLKMGAALIRRQLNYFVDPFSPQGGFNYFGITGNPELDFLEGKDLFSQRGNLLVSSPGFRTWEASAFLQDDWRASPKLTVNLGLRYDVFTPFTEAHNKYSNFNPVTAVVDVAGRAGTSATLNVKTDYTNLQPRIGFADQMAKSLVVRGGYGLVFFPVDYQNVIQNPNPPYTFQCLPCAKSFAAFPVLPSPLAPSITNPAGNLTYKPKNFQPSYMHMFNVAVERQFANTVLTATYVGELQVKQLYQGNLNLPRPNYNSSAPTPAFLYAAKLPNVSNIANNYNGAQGNYNALQVSAVRRTGNGLTFFTNYTWSHTLSDGITEGATTDETGLIPSNPSYDYGNSDFDLRHRVAGSINWEIPFGRDLRGFPRTVLYGWQTNVLSFWQTGQPITINSTAAHINLPGVTADRPNQVGSASVSNPTIHKFFNTAVFQVQPLGFPGNEQVNSVFGPHDRRVDVSLFKTFPVFRSSTLQFRAECFNITNTPNFMQPGATLQDPTFGQISSTKPTEFPREFQFALKVSF